MRMNHTEKTVPVWKKYSLNVSVAAEYYGIGEKRLMRIDDHSASLRVAAGNPDRALLPDSSALETAAAEGDDGVDRKSYRVLKGFRQIFQVQIHHECTVLKFRRDNFPSR